jgi:hypothetical protein
MSFAQKSGASIAAGPIAAPAAVDSAEARAPEFAVSLGGIPAKPNHRADSPQQCVGFGATTTARNVIPQS